MLTVETRHAVHQDHARTMDTAALRRNFLADDMFAEGEIRLIYTHYDRFVMGGAVPAGGELILDVVAETRTPSFLDRRELGVVNIGETGTVAAPTSHWPGGGSSQPRPSMVAVGRTVKPFHIGA